MARSKEVVEYYPERRTAETVSALSNSTDPNPQLRGPIWPRAKLQLAVPAWLTHLTPWPVLNLASSIFKAFMNSRHTPPNSKKKSFGRGIALRDLPPPLLDTLCNPGNHLHPFIPSLLLTLLDEKLLASILQKPFRGSKNLALFVTTPRVTRHILYDLSRCRS